VSIGLLVLGLMAICAAIVYRAAQSSPSTDYVIAELSIPAQSEVVSAVAADGRITVTYRLGAMTSVRIFDGKSGDMISEIPVVSE